MLLAPTNEINVAKELPIDFEALMTHNEAFTQNKRLGKYVEQLLFEYLEHHREIHHLHKNIVLSANKKTVGEIDLVFDFKKQRYHWEVAYKFYLLHDHQQLTAYFGPQGQDRLDLKVNKLLSHQLPLIHHEQLKHLQEEGKNIISQMYLKGWIFYHLHHPAAPPAFPPLHPKHSRGWWLFQHEFKQVSFDENTVFFLVDKERWLTSIHAFKRFYEAQSFESISHKVDHHFREKQHALMLYSWNPETHEHSRAFIVHNKWPDL